MRLSGIMVGALAAVVTVGVFSSSSFSANEDDYKSRSSVLNDESAEVIADRAPQKRGASSDLWAIPDVTDSKPLAVATLESAEEVAQPAAALAPERVTTRRFRPKRRAPKSPTWMERFLQGR